MSKKKGRPTDFTPELGEMVCELHASGYTMEQIAALPNMPCRTSVYRWARKDDEFSNLLDRARKEFALSKIDSMATVVEDTTGDQYTDDNGRRDVVAVKRAELIVGFYKWLAERRLPKQYSAKITQEITGADGAPLIPEINVTIKSNNS